MQGERPARRNRLRPDLLVSLSYVRGSVEGSELDLDGRRHAEDFDQELLEGGEEGDVGFEALRLAIHVH